MAIFPDSVAILENPMTWLYIMHCDSTYEFHAAKTQMKMR